MRILILSIYHDPEPIPKTGELARELQRRGHDVTVVTAFPHYPAGDLYPGYRLAPWRSPYLLWRIETYWGLHADRISPAEFRAFCWRHRAELWRFLQWAGKMSR